MFNIFEEKANDENLRKFANQLIELSEQIGFKVSARGWCYQLETARMINKDQFDRVESVINKCRKKGILPIDFVAEEKIRQEELALKAKAEAILQQKEKEKQDRLKARKSALFQIGFSQQLDNLVFKDLKVYEPWMKELSEAEFAVALTKLTAEVETVKKKIEEERIAREERIKAEAIELEKKRAAEEAEADRIAALEEKEAAEKEHLRIAMLLPDIEKFNNFCKVIASVPVPQFSSPAYVEFAETIKADVLNILKTLHSKKPV